jgi:hypothetical protein
MSAEPTPDEPRIVLHRDAPWARNTLPRGGWNTYVQVGDRKFHAEHHGVYMIYEVGDDGRPLGWEAAKTPRGLDEDKYKEILDSRFVAIAFNRGGVRVAIQRYLAGNTRAQIDAAISAYGHPGTGRNSPANVERRRSRSF